jgi:hypothetical protein
MNREQATRMARISRGLMPVCGRSVAGARRHLLRTRRKGRAETEASGADQLAGLLEDGGELNR